MASPGEKAPALPGGAAADVEANPAYTCCYHNPQDPRVCVCGRDQAQCGKKNCARPPHRAPSSQAAPAASAFPTVNPLCPPLSYMGAEGAQRPVET
jgi:hypothetical protein